MVEPVTKFREGYLGLLRSLVRQSAIRRKMILILIKKDGLTKSDLHKELEKRKDKYNYKTIWEHVGSLQGFGIVTTKKAEHEQGTPVRVYLTPVIKDNARYIKKGLLEDYPHAKIPEEEKKLYF